MYINVKRQQGTCLIDVSIESTGPGITAFLGPSGAGKTSVINMVAGLVRPDSGKISVAGQCLFDSSKKVCLPPEKRSLGYVFQEGRLFPHMSVKSNLTYGHRDKQQGKVEVTFDRIVDLLGIGHLLQRKPRSLSGGEKQRVALGRAMLSSPRLLLMDEPLASLDGARKAELLPFIKQLNRELHIPILYVSHSPEEIATLADVVVAMQDGKVTSISHCASESQNNHFSAEAV